MSNTFKRLSKIPQEEKVHESSISITMSNIFERLPKIPQEAKVNNEKILKARNNNPVVI